jgi:hypothetical protein
MGQPVYRETFDHCVSILSWVSDISLAFINLIDGASWISIFVVLIAGPSHAYTKEAVPTMNVH